MATSPVEAGRPRTATVRLGVFSPSVVLGVAAQTGALARAGLRVEEIAVSSSSQQFSLLLEGELDAVLTSPDNVISYRQSSANPLGRSVDVRILAAVDRGLGLSLFAAPGVDPGTGLRGGVLGVDVPTSGFAFAAYELLARRGLRRLAHYTVEPMGTTPMRAKALIANRCTMTMLNAGSDLRAEDAGCTRVSRASSMGLYVGTVLAARGTDIDRDLPALRALTTTVVSTCRALAAKPQGETASMVTRARLGLDAHGTARYLATLADRVEGLIPDARLDDASLYTLRMLRARHAEPRVPVDADPGLVDERFLAFTG
jgi:hypothetical protein